MDHNCGSAFPEYFAGHDGKGEPIWTSESSEIKPLLDWNNHMGCVTVTYNAPLKKYFMCVTDGWRTRSNMDSYIMEADKLTGPWKMLTYMQEFGTQAYFLNFPSKFISENGKTMWLCYSGNYGWHRQLPRNPPHGRYGLCLYEVSLLGDERQQFQATRSWKDPGNVVTKAKITASSSREGCPVGNLVNGKVCQRAEGVTDHRISADDDKEAWVKLSWDTPQVIRSIRIFDCVDRKDREKFGKIVFSNGHEIPIRMPLPHSTFEGLDIFWGDPKEVTWLKIVFERTVPDSAPVSLADIAVFK